MTGLADPRIGTLLAAYAGRSQCVQGAVREAGEILDTLDAEGICALPLNGIDLLGRAYGGALGVRHISDIDLLVRVRDLPDVVRILAGRGYEPFVNGNPSLRSVRLGHCIDLSTDLGYRSDPEAIWSRSVERPIAGRLRAVMHADDALIHLVAYQTVHRGRLDQRFAQDVTVLLRSERGNLDWARVLEEVRVMGLALPFHHGLAYARQRGGADVPDDVLAALRGAAPKGALAATYRGVVRERAARMPKMGILLQIAFRPGLKAKIRELWRTFFPSAAFLSCRYGRRGPRGTLLARVLRPAVLSYRGGALLFSWVRQMFDPDRARG